MTTDTTQSTPKVGFFTRLMEEASAADRYRFALEQITTADRLGFDTAWIAQHHFRGLEGGLPSPFVLLAAAAQATEQIRLGTAIVSLPLEDPARVAEDAAVVDLISGGRLELGLGSGANPTTFPAFGLDFADRRELFGDKLATLRTLLAGDELGTGHTLYPPAAELVSADGGRGLGERLWQATFSAFGAEKAGEAGDGLMTSRSQPRPEDAPDTPLHDLQLPIIDAYEAKLPAGAQSRVLASRTAFVSDDEAKLAEVVARTVGPLREEAPRLIGYDASHLSDAELLAATNTYLGTPEQVADGLRADLTLGRVTEVSFQVHSVPATHEETLRSIELLAGEVFPALGWR